MRDPVLGDRVAAGRGGEEDLGRLGLVLLYALAVEQHDGVFDLAGDDAVVGRALEPANRLGNILRRPFAVAQHDAVGIGCVVVARVRGAQEILRRLVVVRRLAVQPLERHDAKIVERAWMVLGRGALELRLGGSRIFRHAILALNQHHSEFVSRLRDRQDCWRGGTSAKPLDRCGGPRRRRDRSRRSASSPPHPWDWRRGGVQPPAGRRGNCRADRRQRPYPPALRPLAAAAEAARCWRGSDG